MIRERILRVSLVIFGLMFVATAYPMVLFVRQEPSLAMMLCLYVTLGVFLLLASRNPSAHRSLIAYTAWSSLAHAGLMTFQASCHMIARREFNGVAVFAFIGLALLVLLPPRSQTAPLPHEIAAS